MVTVSCDNYYKDTTLQGSGRALGSRVAVSGGPRVPNDSNVPKPSSRVGNL